MSGWGEYRPDRAAMAAWLTGAPLSSPAAVSTSSTVRDLAAATGYRMHVTDASDAATLAAFASCSRAVVGLAQYARQADALTREAVSGLASAATGVRDYVAVLAEHVQMVRRKLSSIERPRFKRGRRRPRGGPLVRRAKALFAAALREVREAACRQAEKALAGWRRDEPALQRVMALRAEVVARVGAFWVGVWAMRRDRGAPPPGGVVVAGPRVVRAPSESGWIPVPSAEHHALAA